MAESRVTSGNVPLASPADSFNWQAAVANQLRGSGRPVDVNYGSVTGGPTGSYGGGAIWNTVAPEVQPDVGMQPNVQPFQMTPMAPSPAGPMPDHGMPMQGPGMMPPGSQPIPAQPPVSSPAPSYPTNKELIESARGIPKGDLKWLSKLFADPQNSGLAGSTSWATTDPAELEQSVRSGGLNQQNQNILLNALRTSGIDFGPPPDAPAMPMMPPMFNFPAQPVGNNQRQQELVNSLRRGGGGGGSRLASQLR